LSLLTTRALDFDLPVPLPEPVLNDPGVKAAAVAIAANLAVGQIAVAKRFSDGLVVQRESLRSGGTRICQEGISRALKFLRLECFVASLMAKREEIPQPSFE